MAFWDLERWVKIFNFEARFHAPQRADFKISKSGDHHFNLSFDFYSQFCQRTTRDIEAGPNLGAFWVKNDDFSKKNPDEARVIQEASRSRLEVIGRS